MQGAHSHAQPLLVHATHEPDPERAFERMACGMLLWVRRQHLSPEPSGRLTDQETNCMACIAAGISP